MKYYNYYHSIKVGAENFPLSLTKLLELAAEAEAPNSAVVEYKGNFVLFAWEEYIPVEHTMVLTYDGFTSRI